MHRTFLPVGQGAFYCERFEGDGINTKEVINVICDKYSEDRKSNVN